MSFIDTIEHSHVGSFMDISIYHPLVSTTDNDDFLVTRKNLLIGGGSGEHPALILKDIDVCVWMFLDACFDLETHEADEIKSARKGWQKISDNYNSSSENLDFISWSLEQLVQFSNRVKKKAKKELKYYQKKDEILSYSIEMLINIMIGEFVFFSGKSLISEELNDYINNNLHDNIVRPIFCAVVVQPKGYPTYGRYDVINNDGTRKSINLRFDEEHIYDKKTFKEKLSSEVINNISTGKKIKL